MLGTYFTGDNDVECVSVMAGGCANLNYLVKLNISTSPVVLRVYLRDRVSVYKELKISLLLKGKLPVAKFIHVSEDFGYTFAIIEYLPGQTLRDFLLNDKQINNYPSIINEFESVESYILFNVGKALGVISKVKFPFSGFFYGNLELENIISHQSFVGFCFNCLANNKIKEVLTNKEIAQIKDIFKSYEKFFPSEIERNLVHADFGPENILVAEID